jgi:hypothetical protein
MAYAHLMLKENTMKHVLALVLCTFSLFASAQQSSAPSTAQKPPNPEEMKKMMEASMGAVVPMMVKMADSMIEATLQRAEDPATARRVAKFKKNLYDALIKEGFTPVQSLSIVETTALPSATPAMK